jgi:hypothetical protein
MLIWNKIYLDDLSNYELEITRNNSFRSIPINLAYSISKLASKWFICFISTLSHFLITSSSIKYLCQGNSSHIGIDP